MAISAIEFENKDNGWLARVSNVILAPLWYSVKQWFAIFLITNGTVYASVLFSMQHNIFPLWIAIPIAIGIVWTYLSGLAYATAVRARSGWTNAMILSGAITDGLFGILYILGIYKVIPDQPDALMSVALAFAHIAPLIVLVIIFTYCKRNYLIEVAVDRQAELDRQRAIEDDKLDYDRKIRDAKARLVIAREEIKLQELSVKLNGGKTCDKCGNALSQAQYAAMKRYGYCSGCKK